MDTMKDQSVPDLEEQIKSLSLPLCTDVALSNILIYLRKSDQKVVVRHRNVYQNTWGAEEIICKPHSFCCWHDSSPHYGLPVVLPVAYDDRRERFAAMGKFCSFPCAIKFEYTRLGFFHTYIRMLCRLLAHKVYGFDLDVRFHAAPARESMALFGNCGPVSMTVEQLRAATNTTNFRKPPFFTPDRVHQEDPNNPVFSVILYQSWEAGYVVVSSFSDNLQYSRSPSATSVCWHDTEPFEGDPVGIPIFILKKSQLDRESSSSSDDNDDDDDGCASFSSYTSEIPNTYLLYGCFCSIECALAYLFEIRDWNNEVLLMQTHLMAKDYYGISDIVEPANPAWDLIKFEGTKRLVDFRVGSGQNPQKRRDTQSEVFWITTGIEYHSKTLPERGYTTLRKQGIAVTEQLHSPTSTTDQKLLERPLYLQFLEMLGKRNAELSAEENATATSSSSTPHSSPAGRQQSATHTITEPAQSHSRPPCRTDCGSHFVGTGPIGSSSTSRRIRKDPAQNLEVGSLMQYMRKTKPSRANAEPSHGK
jgi:hypothetical protein